MQRAAEQRLLYRMGKFESNFKHNWSWFIIRIVYITVFVLFTLYMFIFAVRIVDRRKAIALYLLGYYRDYEEYDVDFGCTQATEQQKTTTDHSRNVIVIFPSRDSHVGGGRSNK